MGCFAFSGQVCVATKRIYVHDSIYEPFLKAMTSATAEMKLGKACGEDTVLGPLQNEMQYNRVQGLLDDAKNSGYRFAIGPGSSQNGNGYILQPSIIDNPPANSRIVTEEQFGKI